eukprot:352672-Chlamydomonas_euryale.AAC.4
MRQCMRPGSHALGYMQQRMQPCRSGGGLLHVPPHLAQVHPLQLLLSYHKRPIVRKVGRQLEMLRTHKLRVQGRSVGGCGKCAAAGLLGLGVQLFPPVRAA